MAGRRLAGLDVCQVIDAVGSDASGPPTRQAQPDRRSGCAYPLGGLAAAFLAERITLQTRRPRDAMESAVAGFGVRYVPANFDCLGVKGLISRGSNTGKLQTLYGVPLMLPLPPYVL